MSIQILLTHASASEIAQRAACEIALEWCAYFDVDEEWEHRLKDMARKMKWGSRQADALYTYLVTRWPYDVDFVTYAERNMTKASPFITITVCRAKTLQMADMSRDDRIMLCETAARAWWSLPRHYKENVVEDMCMGWFLELMALGHVEEAGTNSPSSSMFFPRLTMK